MRTFTVFLMALMLAGCVDTFDRGGRVVSETITRPQFETVITGIEELAGPVVTEQQQARIVTVAGHVETGAAVLAPIAGAIPGGQGVALVLTTICSLAGAIGTFMGRRKTHQVAKAAVDAADKTMGGGKAICEAAAENGCADLIHAVYARD